MEGPDNSQSPGFKGDNWPRAIGYSLLVVIGIGTLLILWL